ncbi:DEAD/DEAH box helicase family protein [Rothia mucilaginosa]|uniref:restriction endonuclease n=1 Tax=Rothia mucilaginosa TaxID=43675 RepID=UPI00066AB450|nr:DEAD/DEAH box helicase family protein [Rothia mucilaginosa]
MPHPDPQVPTPNPLYRGSYRGAASPAIPSPALQRKGFVFDPSQKHQVRAIESTVALFEGQMKHTGTSRNIIPAGAAAEEDSLFAARAAGVVYNQLDLDREALFNNLIKVQESNYLEHSAELIVEDGIPHYDIEMETGTGKTYVYLRSILELAKNYGFTKFVIVVPSVAIREGVKTSINSMRSHFENLYLQHGVSLRETFYRGDTPEAVYSFATGIGVEVLITTISALNTTKKDDRIIYRERDSLNGLAPIDYIRATRPVVILDEPQRMKSNNSTIAISELNPLAVLRYSATHDKIRNLVYRLDPVDAMQQNLVKKISVAEVLIDGMPTTPYIRFASVDEKKRPLKAILELATITKQGGIKSKEIPFKQGEALKSKANNDAYGDIAVNHISREYGPENAFVELSAIEGKNLLRLGESLGDENMDQVHRAMIRETIRQHLKKEYILQKEGVKVLSLFFIYSVRSYLGDGTNNFDANGDFARWFDEIYVEEVERLEQRTGISNFCSHDPLTARSAYFAQLKAKRGQTQGEYVDSTGKKEDDDAYELIMQDKERLLSHEEPVRFIFSHSALREGWDNPNIFQICVLRTMNTAMERRQTIGRGLRLPVSVNNGTLTRLTDPNLARLTVIANESYRDFAANLQKEYREAGVSIGRVRRTDFAGITNHTDSVAEGQTLGVAQSGEIFDALVKNGMLTQNGEPTKHFTPNMLGFTLDLPEEYAPYEDEIIQILVDNQNTTKFVENENKRGTRKFNPNFPYELFSELWERIAVDTSYRVHLDSKDIADIAVARLKEAAKYIQPLQIRIAESNLEIRRSGVKTGTGEVKASPASVHLDHHYPLPDIVAELQKATDLSRKTIIDVLKGSETLDTFINNPGEYIVVARKILQSVVEEVAVSSAVFRPRIVDDETYMEKTGYEPRYNAALDQNENSDNLWKSISGGGEYLTEGVAMPIIPTDDIFDQLRGDLSDYPLDKLYKVSQPEKTDYDYLVLDSDVERQFAQKLESSSAVKFFMKLPSNFKIDTPSGKYNPDWAYVLESDDGEKTFCVVETKSTHNEAERRAGENQKIKVGENHYEAVNRLILSAKYSSNGSSLKILPKVIYGVKTHEDSPIPG